MRRFLLRFLGLSSLAATIVCAVMDLVASSGNVATVFRPLGTHWLALHEASLQSLHAALVANGPSPVWNEFLLPVLSQPAIVVFGCLALLFLALALLFPGRYRRRRWDDDSGYD